MKITSLDSALTKLKAAGYQILDFEREAIGWRIKFMSR